MLVSFGNVENGAAARDVQPLVAVAEEEVGIQGGEVQGDVANGMGGVYAGEDSVVAAQLGEVFEGHTDTWEGDYCVEDGEAGVETVGFDSFDGVFEEGAELVVVDRIGVRDLVALCWCCFGNVFDGFLAGAVDG